MDPVEINGSKQASRLDGPEHRATQSKPPALQSIDIGVCLERAFQCTKTHFQKLIPIFLIYISLLLVVMLLTTWLDQLLGISPPDSAFEDPDLHQPWAWLILYRGSLIRWALIKLSQIYLSLGLIRIGLNLIDRKPVAWTQLFSGGLPMIRATIASLLAAILCSAGVFPLLLAALIICSSHSDLPKISICFGLLSLAGVWVITIGLRLIYTMPAIVERGLGPIAALKYSSQLSRGHRLHLLKFALLSICLLLAGAASALVGLLFVGPMLLLAWLWIYRGLQAAKTSDMA